MHSTQNLVFSSPISNPKTRTQKTILSTEVTFNWLSTTHTVIDPLHLCAPPNWLENKMKLPKKIRKNHVFQTSPKEVSATYHLRHIMYEYNIYHWYVLILFTNCAIPIYLVNGKNRENLFFKTKHTIFFCSNSLGREARLQENFLRKFPLEISTEIFRKIPRNGNFLRIFRNFPCTSHWNGHFSTLERGNKTAYQPLPQVHCHKAIQKWPLLNFGATSFMVELSQTH